MDDMREDPEGEFVGICAAPMGRGQGEISYVILHLKKMLAEAAGQYLHPEHEKQHRRNISVSDANFSQLFLQHLNQPAGGFLLSMW